MTLKEQIMKLQTYKMFEGEDTVYVERDDVLKALEQQPCEDCISREEAIKIFGEVHPLDYNKQSYIANIQKLPSVTPKTRWIPVSERLPKSGKDVLATDSVDMFVAYVIEKTKGNYEWNSFDENYDKDSPIVAWMQLPEPYGGEEE